MKQTVVGIFDTKTDAKKAVDELRNIGFHIDRVDTSNATIAPTNSGGSFKDSSDKDGIGGFFKSLFNDDDRNAKAYSDVARRSDSVVTVHADSKDEAHKAAQILDKYGSVNVEERARQYGSYGRPSDQQATNTTSTSAPTGKTTIPVIEENVEIGKRQVETGGAQINSRIVERPIEEHLRLRSEHVRVERHEVNRPASDADFNSFKEGNMKVTERAEVPVINKEARVVEEVTVGKEVEQHDQVIRDKARATEVDVDKINDPNKTNRPGMPGTGNTSR